MVMIQVIINQFVGETYYCGCIRVKESDRIIRSNL